MGVEPIYFYGDAEPFPEEVVIHFPTERVVCDYTECGMYIASKHVRIRKVKGVRTTLKDLLNTLEDETPVEAWNNGIVAYFRRYRIKTVGDLKRALGV